MARVVVESMPPLSKRTAFFVNFYPFFFRLFFFIVGRGPVPRRAAVCTKIYVLLLMESKQRTGLRLTRLGRFSFRPDVREEQAFALRGRAGHFSPSAIMPVQTPNFAKRRKIPPPGLPKGPFTAKQAITCSAPGSALSETTTRCGALKPEAAPRPDLPNARSICPSTQTSP